MKIFNVKQLAGKNIELLKLNESMLPNLMKNSNDENIWHKFNMNNNMNPEGFTKYFNKALRNMESNIEIPFAIRHIQSDQLIGSTRFYEIDPENLNVAIGYTWFNSKYWKDGTNRETKKLMLQYVFDDLHYERVQFYVDSENKLSRRSLEGWGAQLDGILRNHKFVPINREKTQFRRRDSCVYSVIKKDWEKIQHTIFQQ